MTAAHETHHKQPCACDDCQAQPDRAVLRALALSYYDLSALELALSCCYGSGQVRRAIERQRRAGSVRLAAVDDRLIVMASTSDDPAQDYARLSVAMLRAGRS